MSDSASVPGVSVERRPQIIELPEYRAPELGDVRVVPPTFLEKWGVMFVACAGFWILGVSTWILIYYLQSNPGMPNLTGMTGEQARDVLAVHRLVVDQWRDSVGAIFDLLVTKTALPILTLLLGYLFGKKA